MISGQHDDRIPALSQVVHHAVYRRVGYSISVEEITCDEDGVYRCLTRSLEGGTQPLQGFLGEVVSAYMEV